MKNSDKYLKYFLYVFLICLGILVGIAIHHYHNLPIAEAINIVDLATLVTTIFLAVYIPGVLDRKLQIRRDKKDLIEKRIVELQALYRKINLIIQNEEPLKVKDLLVIKNTLDVVQHRQSLIISLLRYANFSASFEKDIKKITALAKGHKELLLSGNMEEDTFLYSDDIQQKEELLYNQIDEATSLLIFKLSEA
jgi:hypothetical protein